MRHARLALAAVTLAWAGLIVASPLLIASPHHVLAMAGALTYESGSLICHQRPDRSFHLDGRQLPVCGRCTGIYAGAALAMPLTLLLGASLSARRARWLLAIAAAPTALTWAAEMAGMIYPSNTVRALAGVPLGVVAAWLIASALRPPSADADDMIRRLP